MFDVLITSVQYSVNYFKMSVLVGMSVLIFLLFLSRFLNKASNANLKILV